MCSCSKEQPAEDSCWDGAGMEPSGSAQLCCLLAGAGRAVPCQTEGLRHKQLVSFGSTLGRREITTGCSGIPQPWLHPLPAPTALGLSTMQGAGAVHSWGDAPEPGRRDTFHPCSQRFPGGRRCLPPLCNPRIPLCPPSTVGPGVLCCRSLARVGGHWERLLVYPGRVSQSTPVSSERKCWRTSASVRQLWPRPPCRCHWRGSWSR